MIWCDGFYAEAKVILDNPGSTTGATLTMFLAVWGAVVSTLAIAWNLWRDVSDRPKLDVTCYVGEFVIPGTPRDHNLKLMWRVTNIGRKPSVLTHIGGKFPNGKHFLITVVDLPRMLQPGEYYLGNSNDLSVLDSQPTALWAIDSFNHYWKIPKKMLRELVERGSGPT